MSKFKDYEGIVCKDRTELKLLATLAEAKGYRVCCFFYKKPKYNHLVFLEGWFYDCEDWFIKSKITTEEFIDRL